MLAGYWPCSFLPVYGPRPNLSNKGFIIWASGKLLGTARNPEWERLLG